MTDGKRQAIYVRYHGHCAYCGQHMKQKKMTVDHYVPQSKGGGNNIENLMPCCSHCNTVKASDNLESFRLRFFWDSLRPSELATYDSMVAAIAKKKFYFEKFDI